MIIPTDQSQGDNKSFVVSKNVSVPLCQNGNYCYKQMGGLTTYVLFTIALPRANLVFAASSQDSVA
jgi:hypothetical protein